MLNPATLPLGSSPSASTSPAFGMTPPADNNNNQHGPFGVSGPTSAERNSTTTHHQHRQQSSSSHRRTSSSTNNGNMSRGGHRNHINNTNTLNSGNGGGGGYLMGASPSGSMGSHHHLMEQSGGSQIFGLGGGGGVNLHHPSSSITHQQQQLNNSTTTTNLRRSSPNTVLPQHQSNQTLYHPFGNSAQSNGNTTTSRGGGSSGGGRRQHQHHSSFGASASTIGLGGLAGSNTPPNHHLGSAILALPEREALMMMGGSYGGSVSGGGAGGGGRDGDGNNQYPPFSANAKSKSGCFSRWTAKYICAPLLAISLLINVNCIAFIVTGGSGGAAVVAEDAIALGGHESVYPSQHVASTTKNGNNNGSTYARYSGIANRHVVGGFIAPDGHYEAPNAVNHGTSTTTGSNTNKQQQQTPAARYSHDEAMKRMQAVREQHLQNHGQSVERWAGLNLLNPGNIGPQSASNNPASYQQPHWLKEVKKTVGSINKAAAGALSLVGAVGGDDESKSVGGGDAPPQDSVNPPILKQVYRGRKHQSAPRLARDMAIVGANGTTDEAPTTTLAPPPPAEPTPTRRSEPHCSRDYGAYTDYYATGGMPNTIGNTLGKQPSDCDLLTSEYGLSCPTPQAPTIPPSNHTDPYERGYLVVPGLTDPYTVFVAYYNEQRRLHEQQEGPLFPLTAVEAYVDNPNGRGPTATSSSNDQTHASATGAQPITIDFVYTYVDGNEASLLRDLQRYEQLYAPPPSADRWEEEPNPTGGGKDGSLLRPKGGPTIGILTVYEAMLRTMPELALDDPGAAANSEVGSTAHKLFSDRLAALNTTLAQLAPLPITADRDVLRLLRNDALGEANRYRDFGELRYSLRGLYRHVVGPMGDAVGKGTNAPGEQKPPTGREPLRLSKRFGKVYLVVSSRSQAPAWLNTKHPYIVVVEHKDLFPHPEDSLPNFNSNAIESVIHRIRGLSRFYIYQNNDMVLSRPASFFDFFQPIVVGDEVRFVPLALVGHIAPVTCSRWIVEKGVRVCIPKGYLGGAQNKHFLANSKFISSIFGADLPLFSISLAHTTVVTDRLMMLRMMTEPNVRETVCLTRSHRKRQQSDLINAYSYSYYVTNARHDRSQDVAWAYMRNTPTKIVKDSMGRKCLSLRYYLQEVIKSAALGGRSQGDVDKWVAERQQQLLVNRSATNTLLHNTQQLEGDAGTSASNNNDNENYLANAIGFTLELWRVLDPIITAPSMTGATVPLPMGDVIELRPAGISPPADASIDASDGNRLATALSSSTSRAFNINVHHPEVMSTVPRRMTKVAKSNSKFGSTDHWVIDSIAVLSSPVVSVEPSIRYYFGMLSGKVGGKRYLDDVSPRFGRVLIAVFNDDMANVPNRPHPYLANVSQLLVAAVCNSMTDQRLGVYADTARGDFEAFNIKYREAANAAEGSVEREKLIRNVPFNISLVSAEGLKGVIDGVPTHSHPKKALKDDSRREVFVNEVVNRMLAMCRIASAELAVERVRQAKGLAPIDVAVLKAPPGDPLKGGVYGAEYMAIAYEKANGGPMTSKHRLAIPPWEEGGLQA